VQGQHRQAEHQEHRRHDDQAPDRLGAWPQSLHALPDQEEQQNEQPGRRMGEDLGNERHRKRLRADWTMAGA
jgi:hypothetical protein